MGQRSNLAVISGLLALLVAFYGGRWWEGRRPSDVKKDHAADGGISASSPQRNHRLEAGEIPSASFQVLFSNLRTDAAGRESRVKEIESLPADNRRIAAAMNFFKLVTQLDIREAIRLYGSVRGSEIKAFAFVAIVTAAPLPQLPRLAEFLSETNPPESEREFADVQKGQLMDTWSEYDPVAALQFLQEHPDFHTNFAEMHAMYGWAALDPAAALAWLQSNPPRGDERQKAIGGLCEGWFVYDPVAALDFIREHAPEPDFEVAVGAVTLRLFEDSPEKAAMFVDQLPTDELRRKALAVIAGLDMELLAPGETQPATETAEVLNWAVQFPSELWQGQVSRLMTDWDASDPKALFSWMADLPPVTQKAVVAEYHPGSDVSLPDLFTRVMTTAPPEVSRMILERIVNELGSNSEDRKATLGGLELKPEQLAYLVTLVREGE